jgi:hypothetical protein
MTDRNSEGKRVVHVSDNQRGTAYHFDRDCQQFANADGVRTVPVTHSVLTFRRPCKVCLNTQEWGQGTSGPYLAHKLEALGKERNGGEASD